MVLEGIWGDCMKKESNNDPLTLYLFGDDDSSDIDNLLDELEQNVADKVAKVSDSFQDKLRKRAEEFSGKERESYLENARYLFSIIKGYGNPHFTRNFFDYLFNKTQNMEEQIKKRFVFVAYNVYTSMHSILDEKTGERQNIDSLFGIIWPSTRFSDLGFGKEEYKKLKDEQLDYRIRREVMEDQRFNDQFYEQETLADLTELITNINPLA